MSVLRAVGIDWATEAAKRAVAVLEWSDETAGINLVSVVSPVSDNLVAAMCTREVCKVVAVDAPFGWPRHFSEFVAQWSPRSTGGIEVPSSLDFRYRVTDQVVLTEVPKMPLSVSVDLIGMSARAWARIAQQDELGVQIDVEGDAMQTVERRIIEVYPGATLAVFYPRAHEVSTEGYKSDPAARRRVVRSLAADFNIHYTEGQEQQLVSKGKDSDKVDALLAALTGLIYLDTVPGWTVRRPNEQEREAARQEGWIFFPQRLNVPGAAP